MEFEFIVCDSPAGIETGALMALYFADEAIITTNPEVSSVRDSDRILGILSSKSRRAENGEMPIKEHLLSHSLQPGPRKPWRHAEHGRCAGNSAHSTGWCDS